MFLEKLLDEVGSGDAELVYNSLTNANKIRTCLKNKKVKSRIMDHIKKFIKAPRYPKSNVKSEHFRNEGNKYFSKKNYEPALSNYNLAIKYATNLSLEQYLAFGNRSACFFSMQEYQKCISDIEYAMTDEGYPYRSVKLLVRKGKCLLKLGKSKEALEVFTSAKALMKEVEQLKSDIENGLKEANDKSAIKNKNKEMSQLEPKELKSNVDNGMDELMSSIEKELKIVKMSDKKMDKALEIKKEEPKLSEPLPEVSYGMNPDFPSASVAVELKRDDPIKGRHVVATRRIKQGDTLFVEKPFAFVILPMGIQHCHYCCTEIDNPLPCWGCAGVEYCNEDCRLGGWKAFHKWECGGGLDLCQDLGIAHLGLRLVLVAQAASNTPQSDYADYDRVQSLLSHVDKFTPSDLYQYTLTAAILVTYLEIGTTFFSETDGETDSEDRLYSLGGTILEHIGQLICNGHAITKIDSSEVGDNGITSECHIRIATGIYPSASMMNHSCDHNIMHSFYNKYLVVKASRDIDLGEEVFNCYGPHYRQMSVEERQKVLLEQYKFKCECKPCTDPVLKNFYKKFHAFACPHCYGPAIFHSGADPNILYACMDCKRIFQYPSSTFLNMIKSDKRYKLGEDRMEARDYKGAIDSFNGSIYFKKMVYYKLHESLRECMDQIAKCYAFMGEYSKSFEYIEQNLIGLEEQYGECSTEVAYELAKLCDVCLKLIETTKPSEAGPIIRKSFRYTERAKLITDILFGKWSKEYKEIATIENALLDFTRQLPHRIKLN